MLTLRLLGFHVLGNTYVHLGLAPWVDWCQYKELKSLIKGFFWVEATGLGRILYSKSKSLSIVVSLGNLPNCLLLGNNVNGACEVSYGAYGGETLLHLFTFCKQKENTLKKEGACAGDAQHTAALLAVNKPRETKAAMMVLPITGAVGTAGAAPWDVVERGAKPQAGGAPHGWDWGRNRGTTLLLQAPELGLERASPWPGLPSLAWQPSSAIKAVPGVLQHLSPSPLTEFYLEHQRDEGTVCSCRTSYSIVTNCTEIPY